MHWMIFQRYFMVMELLNEKSIIQSGKNLISLILNNFRYVACLETNKNVEKAKFIAFRDSDIE